ncbi:MAG TPA: rRNA maturation RNase YbeY [Anaerolineales bacterium]
MVHLRVRRSVKLPVKKTVLLNAAQLTLEAGSAPTSSDLSIIVGDDALLERLNNKYRHIAASTDVLSFPSNELDPDTHTFYLGDVVISLPRAQEGASRGGHPLQDELQLLVIHGILHLLGYDHLEETDKKKMQAVQEDILHRLGIKLENTL